MPYSAQPKSSSALSTNLQILLVQSLKSFFYDSAKPMQLPRLHRLHFLSMPVSYKLPRSVQVVIFTRSIVEREFLLLERMVHNSTFWQAVTGSLEEGESHRQAAVREVREETGIVCRAEELIDLQLINVFEIAPAWRAKFSPGTSHNEEVCFALQIEKCEIKLDSCEHISFVWVDFDTAYEMLYWESNKKAFQTLQKLLDEESGARGQQEINTTRTE